MAVNNDKQAQPEARKMQKRVETKEDGRFLIYYTFEEAELQVGDSEPANSEEAHK